MSVLLLMPLINVNRPGNGFRVASAAWIFSQGKFKFTNPEDGTVMYGEGMDFNKDLSFFNAHKTSGLYTIKDE